MTTAHKALRAGTVRVATPGTYRAQQGWYSPGDHGWYIPGGIISPPLVQYRTARDTRATAVPPVGAGALAVTVALTFLPPKIEDDFSVKPESV